MASRPEFSATYDYARSRGFEIDASLDSCWSLVQGAPSSLSVWQAPLSGEGGGWRLVCLVRSDRSRAYLLDPSGRATWLTEDGGRIWNLEREEAETAPPDDVDLRLPGAPSSAELLQAYKDVSILTSLGDIRRDCGFAFLATLGCVVCALSIPTTAPVFPPLSVAAVLETIIACAGARLASELCANTVQSYLNELKPRRKDSDACQSDLVVTNPHPILLPPCEKRRWVRCYGVTDAPPDGPAGVAPAADRPTVIPLARGGFELRLPQAVQGPAAAQVLDVAGRLVARLRATPGSPILQWDGRDAGGRPVPSGVYLARVIVGSWGAGARIVVIR